MGLTSSRTVRSSQWILEKNSVLFPPARKIKYRFWNTPECAALLHEACLQDKIVNQSLKCLHLFRASAAWGKANTQLQLPLAIWFHLRGREPRITDEVQVQQHRVTTKLRLKSENYNTILSHISSPLHDQKPVHVSSLYPIHLAYIPIKKKTTRHTKMKKTVWRDWKISYVESHNGKYRNADNTELHLGPLSRSCPCKDLPLRPRVPGPFDINACSDQNAGRYLLIFPKGV